MELVIDTNVLISGLLNPSGKPGQLIDLIISGQIHLAYDDRIMYEYNDVLRRPRFNFAERNIVAILTVIESLGRPVISVPSNTILPDDSDRCFLECAQSSLSKILITGNKKHFPPKLCRNISVLTPAEFFLEHFND